MTDARIKAGIVAVTEFTRPSAGSYNGYIDYIGRKSAITSPQNQYSTYMDYMSNPAKSTGLFTAHSNSLSSEERKQIKALFTQAQTRGSLLWQTVVSFDNSYLETLGIYNAKSDWLDEDKLRTAIRQGSAKMYEKEGFLNILWTAAIHRNTDNIHVHIAAAEPEPMREKKAYTIYDRNPDTGLREPRRDVSGNVLTREEYKGRFKPSSLQALKREIANELTSNKEITAEINRLIREQIVGTKGETQLLLDIDIRQQLFKLYEKLPRDGNRNLWNYNSPAMAHLRPEIDAISRAYIEKYHPADYARLLKTLEKQAQVYRMTYGIPPAAGKGSTSSTTATGGHSTYAENKINDLYYRLGNAILRELKDYDRNREIQQRSARTTRLHHSKSIAAATTAARMQIAGADKDFDHALMQMKKALEKECREWKGEVELEEVEV